MSIEIKQKTVDIVFEENKDGKLRGNVDTGALKNKWDKANDAEKERMKETVKALRLHFSLMGETSPKLSQLSVDFAADEKSTYWRYDWMVGATPFHPYYNEWNWFDKIAEKRAMIIQLLIDPAGSGCGVSESNAFLLGLLPAKNMDSPLDPILPKLGDGLDKMSSIVGAFSGVAGTLLKISSVISSLVVTDEKGQKKDYKNWFIYRFLDENRRCCGVEWNVSRNVLHQYGSVLRGSLLLAFHGSPKANTPLKLLLRPRISFGAAEFDMAYDPPEKELEDHDPVELAINPV